MASQLDQINLHNQNTDLEIIETLLPRLKSKSFLDIGAEKGTFTQFLSAHGLKGIFFEPLPKFASELIAIAANTCCTFLPFAVDYTDRTADFYVATDHDNNGQEHFSSLHPLNNDHRIKHQKATTVTCRSLDSLYREGRINKQIGLVKIDTEGNDLNVLKGMTEIECEILMCEYFMPGIYAGWEKGHPQALINEAKKMGFNHCITIKRADEYELVSIDQLLFVDTQWGNLIFLKDDIFDAAKSDLYKMVTSKEQLFYSSVLNQTKVLRTEIHTLSKACQERLDVINQLNAELIALKAKTHLNNNETWLKRIFKN